MMLHGDVKCDAPFAEFGETLIYLPVYKKDDGKNCVKEANQGEK